MAEQLKEVQRKGGRQVIWQLLYGMKVKVLRQCSEKVCQSAWLWRHAGRRVQREEGERWEEEGRCSFLKATSTRGAAPQRAAFTTLRKRCCSQTCYRTTKITLIRLLTEKYNIRHRRAIYVNASAESYAARRYKAAELVSARRQRCSGFTEGEDYSRAVGTSVKAAQCRLYVSRYRTITTRICRCYVDMTL